MAGWDPIGPSVQGGGTEDSPCCQSGTGVNKGTVSGIAVATAVAPVAAAAAAARVERKFESCEREHHKNLPHFKLQS